MSSDSQFERTRPGSPGGAGGAPTCSGRLGPIGAALLACAGPALLACGPGVHDLSVPAEPLVTIRGRVDRAALAPSAPDAKLLAVLAWAGKPVVNPLCLLFPDDTRLDPGCADPYGVFTADTELAQPLALAADGTFALQLKRLPRIKVSVGDSVTRIAYGTLLVVEDLNGDGVATFASEPFGDPMAGEAEFMLDRVLAASFHDLKSPQQRLVFREGGFDAQSRFYPAPGCGEPPLGFSVMKAPPYDDPSAGCQLGGVDQPIELAPIAPPQGRTLACRSPDYPVGAQQPWEDMPLEYLDRGICLDADTLVFTIPQPCPSLVVFRLAGCWDSVYCEKPDWDIRKTPPRWWPC